MIKKFSYLMIDKERSWPLVWRVQGVAEGTAIY